MVQKGDSSKEGDLSTTVRVPAEEQASEQKPGQCWKQDMMPEGVPETAKRASGKTEYFRTVAHKVL